MNNENIKEFVLKSLKNMVEKIESGELPVYGFFGVIQTSMKGNYLTNFSSDSVPDFIVCLADYLCRGGKFTKSEIEILMEYILISQEEGVANFLELENVPKKEQLH